MVTVTVTVRVRVTDTVDVTERDTVRAHVPALIVMGSGMATRLP